LAIFGACVILLYGLVFGVTERWLGATPWVREGSLALWVPSLVVGVVLVIGGAIYLCAEAWPAVIRLDRSVVVSQPMEEVFKVVADPRNDPKLTPHVRTVELLDPLGVGVKYREELEIGRRRLWVEFEVVDYQPPLIYAAACKKPAGVGGYRLSTSPSGCEVTSHVETKVNRLWAGRVRRAQACMMEAVLQRLKLTLEGSSAASD
jgi:hypothetical protein